MIRNFKKVVSLMVVLVLILTLFNINVSAETDDSLESTIETYVSEILPGYLSLNNINSSDVKVSDGIPVMDWETNNNNKTMYFVLAGNEVIGKLTVQDNQGDYESSFDVDCLDEFSDCYNSNSDIVIGNSKGRLIIYSNNDYKVIKDVDNIGKVKNSELSDFSANKQDKHKVEENSVITNNIVQSEKKVKAMTSTSSVTLSCSYRANSTVDGNGICWAAVTSSIVDYINGTSTTAKSVYNQVKTDLGSTPTGTTSNIILGYSLNDVTVSKKGALSYDSVISVLSDDTPIHMHLARSGGAHASVLKGAVCTGSDSYYYLLMDPNVSSTVSVAVSSTARTTGTSFTYATSYGYTYTWGYSFY